METYVAGIFHSVEIRNDNYVGDYPLSPTYPDPIDSGVKYLDARDETNTSNAVRTTVFYPGTYKFKFVQSPGETFCQLISDPDPIDYVTVYVAAPDQNRCPDGNPTGNPCNAATGNKHEDADDYDGGSNALRYRRSYNSLIPANIGLGHGWTSTYHKRLELFNNTITAIRPNGAGEPFTQSGGVWLGLADSVFILQAVTGGYTLTLPDGAVEFYNAEGRLQWQDDTTGLRTAFAYDTDGLLDVVTGPFGHTLGFDYNAQGNLETLTDPAGQLIVYNYDADERLNLVTYQDLTSRSYLYDEAVNTQSFFGLTGIIDENGDQYAKFDYNPANGKATLTEHAATGNTTPQERFVLQYDTPSVGQTTVTDASGNAEVLTFQQQFGINKLVSRVNSDSKVISKTYYPTTGMLKTETDENGTITKHYYNATNQRTKTIEAVANINSDTGQRATDYEYLSPSVDLFTKVITASVTPGLHKEIETVYNPDRTVQAIKVQIRSVGGGAATVLRQTTFGYTANKQLSLIDGPRTDVTDHTILDYYDEGSCASGTAAGGKCGQLQSIRRVLNGGNTDHVTIFNSYDAHGRVTNLTLPNNLVVSYAYDLRGRLDIVTETPSSGTPQITDYTYDDAGQIQTASLPSGLILTYEWDAAHDLDYITDNAGNKIDYSYDSRGNQTAETIRDPNGTLQQAVSHSYDIRNRLDKLNLGTFGGSGAETDYDFEAAGNLKVVEDPKGHTTQYFYNLLEQLATVTDPQLLDTVYGNDGQDNVTSVAAPKSASEAVNTVYVHDDLGNVLQETSPDRGKTLYGYDAAGNLTCRADGRYTASYTSCESVPQRVTFSYDPLNRQTAQTYPNDPAQNVTFGWDGYYKGELWEQKHVNRQDYEWFAYDSFGRRTAQWNYIDNGNGDVESLVTNYQYFAGRGLVWKITYPKPHPAESSGPVVTYRRDVMGRIVGIVATFKGNTYNIINGTASNPKVFYKPFGPATQIQFGNGVTQDWLFDDGYRIDRITVKNSSNTSLLDWDYTLDAGGNVQSINKNGATTSYGYNAMDRLTQDGNATFSYDGNGNVLNAGYVNLGYVSNSNKIATRSGASVVYDGMGNVTADSGIVSFGYDAGGRLQTLTRAPVGQPVQTITNQYNGKGERSFTHRVISPTERYVEYYTYAEDGRLLTFVQSVQNSDNSLGVRTVYNYIWLENIPVAQFRVRYPAICVAPTCQPIDTQLTYIHADHLYTPQMGTGYSASTQSNETKVWSIWSSAYGFAGESNDPDGDGSSVNIVLRFPGQVYYGVSTFNYNYYRDYDTIIGRYLESDPIGLQGGLNTYGYAVQNPLRYTDPRGLNPACIPLVAADGPLPIGDAVCAGLLLYGAYTAGQIMANSSDDDNVIPFPKPKEDAEVCEDDIDPCEDLLALLQVRFVQLTVRASQGIDVKFEVLQYKAARRTFILECPHLANRAPKLPGDLDF